MTIVAVLADPPVEGTVLSDLVDTSPLSAAAAARLYEAMLADVCAAVQNGAGELLVNYRPADQVPVEVDPQAVIEESLADELPRPADVRYEVQVGETFAGRAGNTATHLLTNEEVPWVGIVEPTAPFLRRQQLGTATMKLRTRDVVLGPTTGGRVYFTGVTEPIDFSEVYEPPSLQTLTDRARDADLDVDYMPRLPVVETGTDLLTAIPEIRARVRAGRNVPPRTATVVDELGLRVASRDGELTVVADPSDA